MSDFGRAAPHAIYLCGGGRKNDYFIRRLQTELKLPILTTDTLGVNGDFLESQAFAFLGARCYFKLPISFPKTTGVPFPLMGGWFLPLTHMDKLTQESSNALYDRGF